MYLVQDYQLVLHKIYEQEIPLNSFLGVSVREILQEMGFPQGKGDMVRNYLIDEGYIRQTPAGILDGFVLTEKGVREVKNSDLE
jgi:hypothetical protein